MEILNHYICPATTLGTCVLPSSQVATDAFCLSSPAGTEVTTIYNCKTLLRLNPVVGLVTNPRRHCGPYVNLAIQVQSATTDN